MPGLIIAHRQVAAQARVEGEMVEHVAGSSGGHPGAVRILNTQASHMPIPDSRETMAPVAVKWNPMSRVMAFDGTTRPSFRPGRPDSLFYPQGQVLYLLDKSAMTWSVAFDGEVRTIKPSEERPALKLAAASQM